MIPTLKLNLIFFSLWGCSLLIVLNVKAQQKIIDSLENELRRSSPDTNRINILNSLAFYFRSSDSTRGKELREQAFALSDKLNYTKGKGWYYYLEGINLTYQNKFIPALSVEAKAIELGHQIKDNELIARAYNTIGLNHLRLEDDYNAMKAFTTALGFIEKAPDQTIKPALLFNIGGIYSKEKKYREALVKFDQSKHIYLSTNYKSGLSLVYLETGLVYLALKEYDKAISYGKLSLVLARETNYIRTEVNALSLLGSAYLDINNLKARSYFDESLSKATLKNMQREKLNIYKGYAALFKKEGNYRDAYLYQKKYSELYDSVFNVTRSKVIIGYQEKFQTHQKETENRLLLAEQLNTKNEIRQKNLVLNFTFVILAIFILLSGVIFWGNRRIKEAYRLLTGQKNEIQFQKENVEHLNTIKDKLFSVIAHDLRSPFASMKSMMDMYDEGMISKEDVGFFFKEIRRDIGSNTLLLDNLLIWAKSQLQGFKVQPKAVLMEKVVDEITYYYKKKLENRQIQIINKLDDGCMVYADPEMVRSIIRNLVGNAIKFTPCNGTVTISYLNKDDEICIAVTDSGIGIPDDHKDKLFQDAFYTTQGLGNEKGTGLGLQICKEFVEKNNGMIWAESETDKGSSFWFTLPKSNHGAAADDVINTDYEEDEKGSVKEMIKNSARLQNKYDRYELLLKASNDTIWDWDLITNEVTWSEALQSNFGYPFEKTPLEWWSDRIHPEDLHSTEELIYSAIRNKQTVWQTEYRFRCADDSYKYVLDRGLIVFDENDEAIRIVGIMLNTDIQKNAIREIQRLSLVATHVKNLVIITDAEDRIVWVNHAFERVTGYTLNEISGQVSANILSGEDTDQDVMRMIKENLSNEEGFTAEIINYTKAGEPYWVQIDCTSYDDPVTHQKGYVSIHTIITDRKIHEQLIINNNEALREIARISSHEVRNPLSSILGLVKVLKNNADPAEREECIRLLNESAEQLDLLIHRIHNRIAEIENQKA